MEKIKVKGNKVFSSTGDGENQREFESNLSDYKMLWSFSKQVDWKNNFEKLDSIKTDSLSSLSKEQTVQLRKEKDEVDEIIHIAVKNNDKFVGIYSGDDSFSDMIDEIVSYGKDFVLSILKNNQSAIDELKENGVHECFFYTIPYPFDYDEECKYDIKKSASDETKEIQDKLKILESMDFLAHDYKEHIIKEAGKVITYLKEIEKDNIEAFQGKEDDFKEYYKKFNDKAKYANKALEISPEIGDKYSDLDIITIKTQNIIDDYMKSKNISDFPLDFSDFGKEYIDKFKKNEESNKNKNKM
jgi:hypothetical protein